MALSGFNRHMRQENGRLQLMKVSKGRISTPPAAEMLIYKYTVCFNLKIFQTKKIKVL